MRQIYFSYNKEVLCTSLHFPAEKKYNKLGKVLVPDSRAFWSLKVIKAQT